MALHQHLERVVSLFVEVRGRAVRAGPPVLSLYKRGMRKIPAMLLEKGVDPNCIQKESGMCRLWVEEVRLT